MHDVFTGLMREQLSDQPGRETMVASLMNQCLVLVFRKLSDHDNVDLPWISALENPRWAATLDAILQHPERPHTVETLATTVNMSRSAFAWQFQERFGRPPMNYAREIRLRRAARMLIDPSDLSIEAISHLVGFASRSQLSRAFHDQFGCPPTEFRLQAN
jgi:transcriptional regulator GlxA family with amidase domain